MNAIDFKAEPFTIHNPYLSDVLEDTAPSELFQREMEKGKSAQTTDQKLLDFADRVVDWGKALLFNDYERQINIAAKTAEILDWSIFFTIPGMNIAVIVHRFFHFHIRQLPIIDTFPFLLRILTIPLNILVCVIAIIEGFAEILNYFQGSQFLVQISQIEDPLKRLEWLKQRYFTLEKAEGNKIQKYIKRTLPTLSKEEKAKRFEMIAEKALKIKYGSLKRRISSGLAKEVLIQLNSITSDMKSPNPSIQAAAKKRAEHLMNSLTKQGKTILFIHLIGVFGVALAALSLVFSFAVIATGPLSPILEVVSMSLAAFSFIIEKMVIDKEADLFKEAITSQSGKGPCKNKLHNLTQRDTAKLS